MNGTCAAAAVVRPSVSSIRSVAPSSTARAMAAASPASSSLAILGYAIGVQGSPNREERQSGDDVKSMLSNGLRGSANSRAWTW